MALFAVLGAFAACLPGLYMWGFGVDDAFISVRYARHLALGLGYCFNAGGPTTDGVTPLPWAVLLAPLARAGAGEVLLRAKGLGLVSWVAAAALLGGRMATVAAPASLLAGSLALLALSIPVAAHAATGMETAFVVALATVATLQASSPNRAAATAGIVAAFRPETLPWAVALAFGFGLLGKSALPSTRRVPWLPLLLAVIPFGFCAVLRLYAFGRPFPLAVYAKPSDVGLGFVYTTKSALLAVVPIVVLLRVRSIARHPEARAIVAAGGIHLVAVCVAGGDWMGYGRLIAPIVPSLVLASALTLSERRRGGAVCLIVGLLGGLVAFIGTAENGRHVQADRDDLIRRAIPALLPYRRIASADIGWVSAATEETILDLGGVTSPEVAVLRGSHTSKRITDSALKEMHPDAILLYASHVAPDLADFARFTYPRAIERRLVESAFVQSSFRPVAFLPLGTDGRGYVLLRSL